jgi:hypothetical protein
MVDQWRSKLIPAASYHWVRRVLICDAGVIEPRRQICVARKMAMLNLALMNLQNWE